MGIGKPSPAEDSIFKFWSGKGGKNLPSDETHSLHCEGDRTVAGKCTSQISPTIGGDLVWRFGLVCAVVQCVCCSSLQLTCLIKKQNEPKTLFIKMAMSLCSVFSKYHEGSSDAVKFATAGRSHPVKPVTEELAKAESWYLPQVSSLCFEEPDSY